MKRGRSHSRFSQGSEEIAVSAITVAELYYGAERSRRTEQNKEALAGFLLPLAVLPFDAAAAVGFGSIRAALESQGEGLGPYDLLIAACASAHGLTVVTNNIREFGRVPGLAVEDWTRPG